LCITGKVEYCQQSNKERIERQSATGAEREIEGKLASEWTHRDMETDHGERKMTETHNREQNKVGYCRIRERQRGTERAGKIIVEAEHHRKRERATKGQGRGDKKLWSL
jgi:hypothetical protein